MDPVYPNQFVFHLFIATRYPRYVYVLVANVPYSVPSESSLTLDLLEHFAIDDRLRRRPRRRYFPCIRVHPLTVAVKTPPPSTRALSEADAREVKPTKININMKYLMIISGVFSHTLTINKQINIMMLDPPLNRATLVVAPHHRSETRFVAAAVLWLTHLERLVCAKPDPQRVGLNRRAGV